MRQKRLHLLLIVMPVLYPAFSQDYPVETVVQTGPFAGKPGARIIQLRHTGGVQRP